MIQSKLKCLVLDRVMNSSLTVLRHQALIWLLPFSFKKKSYSLQRVKVLIFDHFLESVSIFPQNLLPIHRLDSIETTRFEILVYLTDYDLAFADRFLGDS